MAKPARKTKKEKQARKTRKEKPARITKQNKLTNKTYNALARPEVKSFHWQCQHQSAGPTLYTLEGRKILQSQAPPLALWVAQGSYTPAESLNLWSLSDWSQATTLRTYHLAFILSVALTDSVWAQSTAPQLICKLFSNDRWIEYQVVTIFWACLIHIQIRESVRPSKPPRRCTLSGRTCNWTFLRCSIALPKQWAWIAKEEVPAEALPCGSSCIASALWVAHGASRSSEKPARRTRKEKPAN